jgi:HEXXH motif-containing protein
VPVAAFLGDDEGTPGLSQRTRVPGTRIEFDATDPWACGLFERMNGETPEPFYEQRQLAPVAPLTADVIDKFAEAIRLIGDGWPELRAEIEAHTDLIVPFTGHALGWTNVLYQGAIFVQGGGKTDVCFAVERIAHEASHSRLYVMMGLGPLHNNAHTELVSSPFRRDPRPITGLYHAIFVYTRVLELMHRLARLRPDLRFAARKAELHPKFDDAVATLKERGRLTAFGSDLLAQMEARVRELH